MMKKIDENFVIEETEELLNEEKYDEFKEYFDEKITPKIMITTNDRPKK